MVSKPRKLSRRNFLGAVALGASLLFPSYLPAQEQRAPSFFSLKATGLPREFKEKGFEIAGDWNMNYGRELFIIGENHLYPNILDLESKLIDYLVREYKADSIGIEGFWGGPNEDLVSKVRNEYLNPLGKDLEREFGEGKISDPLKRRYEKLEEYKKFIGKINIPCYGLEEKDLSIKVDLINSINEIINYTIDKREKTEYEKIENIRLKEKFFIYLKTKLPEEKWLKDQTLKTISEDDYDAKKRRDECAASFVDTLINQRNKAFARNIESYTKKLGSKKGIIITGNAHTEYFLAGFAKHDNLQHYLEFNSLIVRSPGINSNAKN
ncbi:Uncharacterised protein [uncultured archaeon]|nr:Uncharacterised protein [uncultured archaeon]